MINTEGYSPDQKNNRDLHLIRMDNISKSFSAVRVLDKVKFDLKPGEVHVLAGENGAGKSTLIKILSGVHTDYSGQISLNDQAVRFTSVQDAARQGISIIHQELSLVASMNIAENIFLGREESHGLWLNHHRMELKATKLLEDMGLDIDVTRPVESYPFGIQQMIEICKALAFDSQVIVMDEPTSALKGPDVDKLFEIMTRLKNKGCGIIFISHKMDEIYRMADRITVLRDGKYIGTGATDDVPQDRLVHWMVGRELERQFPPRQSQTGSVRLDVKNLTVPHPAGHKTPVVNDVTFQVHAGEILGLAGLQGSGISDVVNGLFGAAEQKVNGTVKVDGKPLTHFAPRHAIDSGLALLTNDRKARGLIMSMNIIKNTTLTCLEKFSRWSWLKPNAEKSAADRQTRALKLRAAGLDQMVEFLSGGNQQKVVLAKWTDTNPKVLL
ncbi:MAG: sugar ABC transporter ATP-binding protein, partial [Planctomycetes bacterium]|nr:sugar ABC transporter ATP-binding protein [Planctomycetota bacterium]